ncbi:MULTISPECIES: DMT family transporter [Sellimonas]|uniref:EamA family transporter n=1 Tax=Sellimonas caecigallum TaxID=2592333 RepID=A0ABS7L5J2_9FIRM|nr:MULTISPECIES: DMT family transporter [Sellimonas]MBY0758182.1 EamA family transporter [Sellimonas caecigallum]OUP67030.1 EamA family transporter [Drancourtella sp. An177]
MNHMERREALRGMCIALIGGIFWGLAGVFGQYLFEFKGTNARWLVSVRLLLAGLLLLSTVLAKQKKDMWRIWKNKKDVGVLILFAIFGMAGCQLTYYTAVELSNAGTATVLQYTAPVIIMVCLAVWNRRVPRLLEILALACALFGTFMLATHGNVHSLAISREALFWGLGSAVMMAAYNLIPGRLMKEYGTFCVIGWGMLLGGIFLSAFTKPWHVVGTWDGQAIGAMAVVVVVGTVLSFSFYMEGVRIIGAAKASLFASVEPVTATIATVLMMHAAFTAMDFIGFVFILAAVLMLSVEPRKK